MTDTTEDPTQLDAPDPILEAAIGEDGAYPGNGIHLHFVEPPGPKTVAGVLACLSPEDDKPSQAVFEWRCVATHVIDDEGNVATQILKHIRVLLQLKPGEPAQVPLRMVLPEDAPQYMTMVLVRLRGLKADTAGDVEMVEYRITNARHELLSSGGKPL